MKKPFKDRKQITLTFTEEGRQTADSFCNTSTCLIATELKLLGAANVTECVIDVFIDHVHFLHKPVSSMFLHFLPFAETEPFYGPEVVGKKLVLRRAK